MKTRYTIDAESGHLIDRDGNSLGRVVGITLDSAPLGGRGVKSVGSASTSTAEGTASVRGVEGGTRPTASRLEQAAVARIWRYWKEISGKAQKLDSKRERIIRNAIRLVGEEATMQALLGLTRSPHHRGQNEQRKQYMEVRYALKGIGDESDDERIEKAISWAAMYATDLAPVDTAKVERWLDEVREFVGRQAIDPSSTTGRDRAVEAYRKLAAAGFRVTKLDRPPWARVSR